MGYNNYQKAYCKPKALMNEMFLINRTNKLCVIHKSKTCATKYYHKYKKFLTDEQVQKAYNEERRVMRHMKQNKKGGMMKGRARRG